jgi:hypothetical protein
VTGSNSKNPSLPIKKVIIVTKRNSWKIFCTSTETVPEASRLNRILSKANNMHLGCLKLPTGDYTKSMGGTMVPEAPSIGSLLGFLGVPPGLRGATEAHSLEASSKSCLS